MRKAKWITFLVMIIGVFLLLKYLSELQIIYCIKFQYDGYAGIIQKTWGNGSTVSMIPHRSRQPEKVTRIIHQSWKNRLIPKHFQRYFPSWKTCFPNWHHRFWTDTDNRNLVKESFPWFLKIYDSFPQEIYRADVARYFYMYQYGGIYTDMDNECLAPFEHLLVNYTFVFGTIDNVNRRTPLPENYVQNSFMYSKPKQSFWLNLVKNIRWKLTYGRPDIVTGPILLCDTIHKYRNCFPKGHGVKIYDAWYFNPLSWDKRNKYSHCKPLSVMNDDDWKECRKKFLTNGSFVVQYHTHVWE